MQLAIRSSLSAGVAVVGATAIAFSPLAPPPPDIASQISQVPAVFAEYTPTSLASAIQDILSSVAVAGVQGLQGAGIAGAQALAGHVERDQGR